MIAGKLDHWNRILGGPVWERAFTHILSLGPAAEEGITELIGMDMYARVMSYDTVEPAHSKLEAHREFIDIQCALVNGERIDWFPLDRVEPATEYNSLKDVTNFNRSGTAPISICVEPGMFAVFFPEDAHMPKLIVDEPRRMKKVVVKIRLSLLAQSV